ncbi:hypothetical protein BSKO_06990 [Bryopsis sp. KO-2023]|nr:hypothetical protein BSKO_06990 [Bryopsis sp. KO-2023]
MNKEEPYNCIAPMVLREEYRDHITPQLTRVIATLTAPHGLPRRGTGLEDILQVEQVNVVERVNTKNLRTLLQWVVDQLQRRVAKTDLDELREELSGAGRESNEKVKQLEKKQGEIVKELALQEETLKDAQNAKTEVQDLSSQLGELGARVEALEKSGEEAANSTKQDQENAEQVKSDVKVLQDEVDDIKQNMELTSTKLDALVQENEEELEEASKSDENEEGGVKEDQAGGTERLDGNTQEERISTGEEHPFRRRSSTSGKAAIKESLEGLENRICAIEEAIPAGQSSLDASARSGDEPDGHHRHIVPQSSINKKKLQALEDKIDALEARLNGASSGHPCPQGDDNHTQAAESRTGDQAAGEQDGAGDGIAERTDLKRNISTSSSGGDLAKGVNDCNNRVNQLEVQLKSLNERVDKKADADDLEKDRSEIALLSRKIGLEFADISSPPSPGSAVSAYGQMSSYGRSDPLELDVPTTADAPRTGDESQNFLHGAEITAEGEGAVEGGEKTDVGTLASAVQNSKQKKADMSTIDQMKLRLEKLMGEVRKLSEAVKNVRPSVGGNGKRTATSHELGSQGDTGTIQQQIEDLRDIIELVGSAAGVLAVGPAEDEPDWVSIPSTNFASASHRDDESIEHKDGQSFDENSVTPLIPKRRAKAAIERLYGRDRGALRRLENLMERGDVHHKMDSFDPDALNKLAFKLASLENSMRQQFAVTPNGVPKEVEKQLRRLNANIRQMKSKMQDAPQSPKVPFGDYAMLSTKPMVGYKCMACDRPLEKLGQYAGPYIPNDKLPGLGRTSPELRSEAGSPRQTSPSTPDGKRGPQHWYDELNGPAAQHLPKEDVGPHLPPGGWRGHERLAGVLRGRVTTSRESLPRIDTPLSR